MISKEEIERLESLPIEQVAAALGMKIVRGGRTLCPFHSDTRESLYLSRKTNRYHCFVCQSGGTNINLTMHMMGLTFRDACFWLALTFGVRLEDECRRTFANMAPRPIVPEAKPPVATWPVDRRYLARLMEHPVLTPEAEHFLYEVRKISPEVVHDLGISSISRPVPMSGHPMGGWFCAPALLFPYRNLEGEVVSVQARYLGLDATKSRFQFPRGNECHIFNMPVLKTLCPDDELWVTEGVTDCLAAMSALSAKNNHRGAVVAIPSATLLKPEDAALLHHLHIKIRPDDDEAGQHLLLELRKYCPHVENIMLPVGYKDLGQWWAKTSSVKCQL